MRDDARLALLQGFWDVPPQPVTFPASYRIYLASALGVWIHPKSEALEELLGRAGAWLKVRGLVDEQPREIGHGGQELKQLVPRSRRIHRDVLLTERGPQRVVLVDVRCQQVQRRVATPDAIVIARHGDGRYRCRRLA